MLAVRDLEKAFDGHAVLLGVSFEAPDGTVTGLLGPNGAGKTTTLRILCGLLASDRGAASVDGQPVAQDPIAARRALGVLPDDPGEYPRLTPREHLRYTAALHGLRGCRLEEAVEQTLERLSMQALAERRCAGFSRGERRKLALARALVHGPQNLILDEPTTGLDVLSAREVRLLVRRLASEGRCVLFSSHVLQEVAAVCDRVVVMAGGRLVASGTPDQLIEEAEAEDLEQAFVRAIGSEAGLLR